MMRISKRNIIRVISIIFLIIALFAAYYVITNWRAQYAYNAATNSLIANMKSAKNIYSDKDILVTQQQQTDAQFSDAKSQQILLLPKLSENIEHNSEISRKFTESLKQKNSKNNTKSPASKSKQLKNSSKSEENKNKTESSKPKLNNTQKNKVEDLLKQNNKVNPKDQQDQEDQDNQNGKEKTTKRTTSSDGSNKPW